MHRDREDRLRALNNALITLDEQVVVVVHI